MSAPTARWAHQAVFVPSQAAMYVIGGEVDHYGSQIVNDVFVLPLNSTNPSFIRGPNSALPPHSYASTTLSKDGNSLVVIGGLTSSCATDSLAHSLDLTNSSATWVHASPTKAVRRRGAAAEFVDDGTATGKVMVVGGVADKYVCSSGSYTYPAADVLSLPLGSGSLVSTRSLPTSLTGSQLSVSDFGLARNKDGSAIYLVGGQDASGTLVPLNTVGKWTVENGWESQSTTGDVPPGRVGASLVAHPNLDLLVLHGGSTTVAAATGTDVTASSLLAFLNTTTWEWSTPHNLQPPASSAAAFHSSVMTDSGVMIAAFGLGPNGSPRSDMYYLDMRDPTASTWTWKSYWKPEMLSAYTPPVDTNTGAIATNNNLKDSSDEKKKITSITVPVIIATLILLPLAIWFIRRKLRINKKRRMARHFSFSESEDNGDFNRSLAQRSAGSPDNNNRMTFTQYGFGRDANEKEGNVLTDLIGHIKRLSKRRSSTDSDDEFIGGPMQTEREMVQVGPRTTTRLNEKTMKWEEIDFGLGRLDERAQGASARNSTSLSREDLARPGVASTMVDPFADGSAVEGDLIDVGSVDSCATPLNDGHPALTVNIHPPTAPSTLRLSQHTFGSVNTSPDSSPEQKRFSSASASRDPFKSQEDGLDWSVLAQEMLDKPAFRSISPTSTLRSHSHPNAMPQASTAVAPASMDRAGSPLPYETDMQSSDNVAVTPPRLPSFEFQRPSTQPTVALVNAKIGRRISDVQSLPFAGRRLPQPPKNRAVSQPHTDAGPRQLIGSVTPVTQLPRRGSLPQPPSTTPAPEGRRLSNPSIVISPDSPVLGTIKRESQLSKLRVVNMTEDDESSVTSSPTV